LWLIQGSLIKIRLKKIPLVNSSYLVTTFSLVGCKIWNPKPTTVGYFRIQRFEPKPYVPSLSSPPKNIQGPHPPSFAFSPILTGKGICCNVSKFEFGAKETKAWRQKLLRSLVFMNMTKNKIVWSGLVSLDDGSKAFEHLMDPFFCIGRIFRYHEFYVRICVWKTPRSSSSSLQPPFCQLWLPWAPPPFLTCYFITTKSQI